MKQEDKDKLLQNLCARLPYGVKIALKNSEAYHHDNIAKIGDTTIDKLKGFDGKYFRIVHDNPLDWSWFINEINIEDIKPYLFPLSSMTEEQYKEYCELEHSGDMEHLSIPLLDWCNKNHFDYRGLIEMGLAMDATELNIY